jgi:hypothetical protein
MNERVKILWAKAAESNFGDSWEEQTAFMSKFAELIVRKCLYMIENEASTYVEPVWAVELVNDIREHFGVEE